MSKTKLSIIILALPSRSLNLAKLVDNLTQQIGELPVELLYLGDNYKIDPGIKRNVLVNMSVGDYIVHIDDDDRITDDYISSILKAIESNKDCVVFDVEISINGKKPGLVKYGKDFEDTNGAGTGTESKYSYFRRPNHIMCIKREIAIQCPFKETGRCKDFMYSGDVGEFLKSEERIDKVLYYYDFNSEKSEAMKRFKRYPDLYPKNR
jgi:glycosyltransferase involved in cell wall biosynthesis